LQEWPRGTAPRPGRAVGGAVATAARGAARVVSNTFYAADDEVD
jgi:hypothetical protein